MPFVRGTRVHRSGMRGVAVSALAVAALGAAGCSTIMHPLGGGNGPKSVSNPNSAAQIGVNGYLWRATLDTLSFMPLASADPYGGVVITDWYINPEKQDERFKSPSTSWTRACAPTGLTWRCSSRAGTPPANGSTPPRRPRPRRRSKTPS